MKLSVWEVEQGTENDEETDDGSTETGNNDVERVESKKRKSVVPVPRNQHVIDLIDVPKVDEPRPSGRTESTRNRETAEPSSNRNRGGHSNDGVPSYTPNQLQGILGCSDGTFARYTERANCARPDRGGNNFMYEGEKLLMLLRWLRDDGRGCSNAARDAAKRQLDVIETDS